MKEVMASFEIDAMNCVIEPLNNMGGVYVGCIEAA